MSNSTKHSFKGEIHYENEEYRLDYNDTSDIRDYFNNHDHEQTPRINKIGIEKFRDKLADLKRQQNF